MTPLPWWNETTVGIASFVDTPVSLSSLRDCPLGQGYHCLYVLKFDNGLTKVGRSASPRRRLSSHITEAHRWGVEIEAGWVSAPFVADAAALERQLIVLCTGAAAAVAVGRKEYFTGLPFAQARTFALSIAPPGPLDRLVEPGEEQRRPPAHRQLPPHILLTAGAAATELGLNVQEVRTLCRRNELRCRRVGRAIRIPGSAINEFRSNSAGLCAAAAGTVA